MNLIHPDKTSFINPEKIRNYLAVNAPSQEKLDKILNKALKLKGLSLDDAATLLQITNTDQINQLLQTAGIVKDKIYGKRMVLFAPLYIGNRCSNNCLYCGFRKENKDLHRMILDQDQIRKETESLVQEGHKRILMLCGESKDISLDYFMKSIETVYSVKVGKSSIRRINVEIAPMGVEDFRKLKTAKIGTYACFQETYDPELYPKYHPTGPKSDYEYRLTVMDRAMEAGIDDVGVGVLFGLADYRFEVMSLFVHAKHLENRFGCGPHTVSVPRIEPADHAPISSDIPYPVSDADFKKIIAIIRMTLPYTGIILSTRESEALRTELFQYGISQISAGSRTNPGGYSQGEDHSSDQFSLGDHRSLDEVISSLIDKEYIPSFCTGCYRKGRVGNDFMDLAKPGLIKEFCFPNALFSFKEYLLDFAAPQTREKGLKLIENMVSKDIKKNKQGMVRESLDEIDDGQRDIYL